MQVTCAGCAATSLQLDAVKHKNRILAKKDSASAVLQCCPLYHEPDKQQWAGNNVDAPHQGKEDKSWTDPRNAEAGGMYYFSL